MPGLQPMERPPCASAGCPHCSPHMSPGSFRAFSSPAWMRGWPEARHEALLRSLLVPWCSELPAGSACGGSNRSDPERCPQLTRRSPAQPQGARSHSSVPTVLHPRGFPPGKAEPVSHLVKEHCLQEVDDGSFMVQLWEENGKSEYQWSSTGTGKRAFLRSCLCSCGQKEKYK